MKIKMGTMVRKKPKVETQQPEFPEVDKLTKPKIGRPEKEINWKEFEDLCHLQCTQSEIASVFHIHHETLIRRVELKYEEPYASAYKKFADGGKKSLRRMQWAQAEKSCAMAIFLGKQYLGQRDTFDTPQLSPIQTQIDQSHENTLLKAKIRELEKQLENSKPLV